MDIEIGIIRESCSPARSVQDDQNSAQAGENKTAEPDLVDARFVFQSLHRA
jgi:hypothetical protein